MSKWNKDFVVALAERVVSTFLQALLAVLVVDGFDVANTDWATVLAVAGTAAGVSLIKGVLANIVTNNGPSLTDSEQVVPHPEQVPVQPDLGVVPPPGGPPEMP